MKNTHQERAKPPRDLQAKRLRWRIGCSSSTARTIADLVYGAENI